MTTFRLLIPLSLAISCLAADDDMRQGLVVTEFPRHVDQTDQESLYIDPAQFGEPIGRQYIAPSLANWKYDTDRNAIAQGWLKADRDGIYRFMTDSFYDRNVLKINGELICEFRDGDSTVNSIPLQRGLHNIESIGYVDGRGATQGILVRWQPPGQREFSEIPADRLLHQPVRGITYKRTPIRKDSDILARWMTVVAKDFVIEVYKNGKRIPDRDRKLLLDRFGATAERINTEVRPGDWLVFHVAHNRLRHKGSKYFAVAGSLDEENFGFVTRPGSENWSVCDSPALSGEFIRQREFGTEARAMSVDHPWEEGRKFMKQYTGRDFPGKTVWGAAPSTWIKFTAPEKKEPTRARERELIDI